MINNAIGVHPKALLNYDTIDAETKTLIDAKMKGCSSPKEFYTQKIVVGFATLVCSDYPQKIILRLSDFKSTRARTSSACTTVTAASTAFPLAFSSPCANFRSCPSPDPPFPRLPWHFSYLFSRLAPID